jgi:hypothetical protein
MRYAGVLLAHAAAMLLALGEVDAGFGFAVVSWSLIAVVVALIVLLRRPSRYRAAIVTLAPLAVIAAAVGWTMLLNAAGADGLGLYLDGPLTFLVSVAVAVAFALISIGRAVARASQPQAFDPFRAGHRH